MKLVDKQLLVDIKKKNLKFLLYLITLTIFSISCSGGRYATYNFHSDNIRANRERPNVHYKFTKRNLKKNIKMNKERPIVKNSRNKKS